MFQMFMINDTAGSSSLPQGGGNAINLAKNFGAKNFACVIMFILKIENLAFIIEKEWCPRCRRPPQAKIF